MNVLFFCLVTATVSGSVFKIPKARTSLEQHLESFIDLIPFPELSGILAGYLENKDAEVMQLVEFTKAGRLQNLVFQIYSMPEVHAQIHELDTKGIHVLEIYDLVKKTIEERIPENPKTIKAESKGIIGMYNQMVAVLPVPELISAGIKLMMMNEEMHVVIEQLRSQAASEAAKKVFEMKDVAEDLNKLREVGVDVDAFKDIAVSMLGWSLM